MTRPTRRALLADLSETLSRHVHVLQRHPELLFQRILDEPDEAMARRTLLARHDASGRIRPHFVWRNKQYETGAASLVLPVSRPTACVWPPGGRELITAGEGGIEVWDPGTGVRLRGFPAPERREAALAIGETGCAPSPCGRWILSVGLDGVALRDAETGETILQSSDRAVECAWSPDGSRFLVSGGPRAEVDVWEVAARSLVWRIKVPAGAGWVTAFAWSPCGNYIVTVSNSAPCQIWRLGESEPHASFECVAWSCRYSPAGDLVLVEGALIRAEDAGLVERLDPSGSAGSWSPDGSRLAWGRRYSGTVWIANAANRADRTELTGVPAHLCGSEFSPSGDRLLTWHQDGGLRIWNAETGSLSESLTGHSAAVADARWSPCGTRVVSRSRGGDVRLWHLERRAPTPVRVTSDELVDCALAPDGRRCLLATSKGAEVWDLEGPAQVSSWDAYTELEGCRWSPDGSLIASIFRNGPALRIWDAETGRTAGEVRTGHYFYPIRTVWLKGTTRLVTGGADWMLAVWDRERGELIRELFAHFGAVNTIAVAPDGERFASGSSDTTVAIWELDAACSVGGPITVLRDHQEPVEICAWSPSGARLASASRAEFHPTPGTDNAPRLWDVDASELVRVLDGHQGRVTCCAFSPDGSLLATSSTDGTIRLWEGSTGRDVRVLHGHGGAVISCAWSADGRRLASASVDHRLIVWDADSGRALVSYFTNGVPHQIAASEDLLDFIVACRGGEIYWLSLSGLVAGRSLRAAPRPVTAAAVDSLRRAKHNLAAYGRRLQEDVERHRGESRIQRYNLQIMDSNWKRFLERGGAEPS